MNVTLTGVMTIEVATGRYSFSRYGRPLFKFSQKGNVIRISTFGCENVTTVTIVRFRHVRRPFLLRLFMYEMVSFDAVDESGDKILTFYRFRKYRWLEKLVHRRKSGKQDVFGGQLRKAK